MSFIKARFIHEKYHNWESDRLEGWWGNKYSTRFEMKKNFDASKNASGWSISNMPILSSAPLRISLGLYNTIGMDRFRNASVSLTNYLESLIKKELDRYIKIITYLLAHIFARYLSFYNKAYKLIPPVK